MSVQKVIKNKFNISYLPIILNCNHFRIREKYSLHRSVQLFSILTVFFSEDFQPKLFEYLVSFSVSSSNMENNY